MNIDTLPHNIEAEQQILGALLTNNGLLSKVVDALRTEHFYEPVHARIFDQIVGFDRQGRVATPVTLKSVMADDPGLADLGGPPYLARLAGSAIGPQFIADYAGIIIGDATRRRIMMIADDAKVKAGDSARSPSDVAIELETEAGKASASAAVRKLTHSHLSAITGAVKQLVATRSGEGSRAVSTGIRQLDNQLGGGFWPGEMIVCAGRPGMCKTSVAQAISMTVAEHGTVFFASVEMNKEENARRFLSCGLARRGVEIPYSSIRAGRVSEDEFRHVVEEAKRQEAMPIITSERNVRTVEAVRSAARKIQREVAETSRPLKLLVVDYLQLLQTMRDLDIRQRVSEVADQLKTLAQELEIPVLALSQLSRSVEMRDPPVPVLSDLRESGKIEEDADCVLMLYREEYYLERAINRMKLQGKSADERIDYESELISARNKIDFIVEKQRSGATGRVQAYIKAATCHLFSDWAAEPSDDARLI